MLQDQINKDSCPDSPWGTLLAHHGCSRYSPQAIAPCPCVWRRPKVGPQSEAEKREYRWDWRSAKKERAIRLALQLREITEVTQS